MLHLLKNGEGIYVSKLVSCWFAYFHSTSTKYTMPALLQKVQAEILLLFANFQSIPSYIKQFCCAKAASKAHSKWADDPLSFPCTIRWSLQALEHGDWAKVYLCKIWNSQPDRKDSRDTIKASIHIEFAWFLPWQIPAKFAKILRYGSWKVVIILGSDKLAQFLCNDQ